jgi:hypothetical protein
MSRRDWRQPRVENYRDRVWIQRPMNESYTCCCGIAVHPSFRNLKEVHIQDCVYSDITFQEYVIHLLATLGKVRS